jgi:nucleoside-diphosphate-sugar epimerase
MKISILGCGWLGFPLAKHLIEKGHSVKGSTTSVEKIPLLTAQNIEPFLLQFSPIIEGDNIAQFLDSEILIICIPPRAGKYGDSFHVQQIQSLIAHLSASAIKSIIYTSSTSVYPELNQELTEDSPTLEHHPLVQVENLLTKLPQNTTILRCGGLMGEERIPAKYFQGKIINTGQTPVNYVHQDDVVLIITMILEQGFWNDTFNVVAPEHPVREAVFLKNCATFGFKIPIFQEPTEVIPYKIISPQKLILRTNYQFKYPNPLDFEYH